MITPDELIKQILDANSGDGRANVIEYGATLLRRYEQDVRRDEISRCAMEWSSNQHQRAIACVVCGEKATTTAAHIPVCQKHWEDYEREARSYSTQRPVLWAMQEAMADGRRNTNNPCIKNHSGGREEVK